MLWSYLKNAKKPILIYGMGNGADKIMARLDSLGIPVSGVFASDGFARHNKFHGYTVISKSEALEKYGDMIALIAFGSSRPEVLSLFKELLDKCQVYAPEVPVCGDGIFDLEYARKNKAELSRIYGLLEDGVSRKAFENTVMFKLTGDIRYLFDCETSPKEAYENIIKPEPGDIYVDLGAYRGETIDEFISFCPEYGGIIAFEPDKKTFKKLSDHTRGYRDTRLYNLAAYSEKAVVNFLSSGGRQSLICGDGEPTPCDSVDNILAGSRASYIKLDVEGQEINALRGCAETIKKFRPKLCVSAYHRTEDYLTIPNYVMSLRDDYKIYMRHYPYVPDWDTCYFFV